MIKWLCFLLVCFLFVGSCAQQPEQVFVIKKKPAAVTSKKELLPNLDFLTGIDTLRGTIIVDATKMMPFFDSIATLNLKVSIWANNRMMISGPYPPQSCKGILKLFKKKPNGEAELVYFHAFRVEYEPVKE